MVGVIGGPEPSEIGDIFPHHALAVEAKLRAWAISVKLRREGGQCCVKASHILRAPPVPKTPPGIIEIAEQVEAVTDLMRHASARGAVVGRCVTIRIEVRWLENAG